jgi:hypothetical protein
MSNVAGIPDVSDVLAIDSLLSTGELAVREKVRDFTNQRIRPGIAQWYDDGVFPLEPAAPPSNTAWPRWNWKRATPASARSSPCRARSP